MEWNSKIIEVNFVPQGFSIELATQSPTINFKKCASLIPSMSFRYMSVVTDEGDAICV